jgi:hypothetical protein
MESNVNPFMAASLTYLGAVGHCWDSSIILTVSLNLPTFP